MLAMLLVLGLTGPALAQSADSTARLSNGETATISLDQARGLARRAFLAGDYELANYLAQGLILANAHDVAALILLAATEPLLGRADAGRKAGAAAWRLSESKGLRHEIAFYTARAALFDKRFLASKFWLRRAWQSAGDDSQRARIAHDFRRVKAVSPWTGRLTASLAPSSNLNSGSQWDWLLIDDTFIVGELSGAAQALSGWHAALSGDLGYKVSRGNRHETILGLSAYHSFNFLSSEARILAPDVANADLNFASLRLFVDHKWQPPSQALLPDHLRLSYGKNWYGGDALGSFATLKIGRTLRWSDAANTLRFSTEARQDWDVQGQPDNTTLKGGADYSHRFGNGNLLSFGLGVQQTRAESANNTFRQADLRLGYAFAQALGPARISLEMGLRARDYPVFYVGPFAAPNGREDMEISGRISFSFDQVDYFGFSPVVTFNAAQNISNITRFETQSYGISVSFKSVF